jgi:hypothetical protein
MIWVPTMVKNCYECQAAFKDENRCYFQDGELSKTGIADGCPFKDKIVTYCDGTPVPN